MEHLNKKEYNDNFKEQLLKWYSQGERVGEKEEYSRKTEP